MLVCSTEVDKKEAIGTTFVISYFFGGGFLEQVERFTNNVQQNMLWNVSDKRYVASSTKRGVKGSMVGMISALYTKILSANMACDSG